MDGWELGRRDGRRGCEREAGRVGRSWKWKGIGKGEDPYIRIFSYLILFVGLLIDHKGNFKYQKWLKYNIYIAVPQHKRNYMSVGASDRGMLIF